MGGQLRQQLLGKRRAIGIGDVGVDLGRAVHPGDDRRDLRRTEAETLARVEQLKQLCARYFPTLAEAAMRFSLSAPEVSTVIPGMHSPAEVETNIAYADGAPFPDELLAQLAAHSWPRNYYQ